MISVSSNFITFIKGILDWIVLVLFLYLNFGYDENMRGRWYFGRFQAAYRSMKSHLQNKSSNLRRRIQMYTSAINFVIRTES